MNCDFTEYIKQLPDNYFELAIADPPYGIDISSRKTIGGGSIKGSSTIFTPKKWDKKVFSKKYFQELFRVSKNQIIFGGNHFIDRIPCPSSCWIVWDKLNGNNDFADCELAWTSFKTAVRKIEYRWNGFLQGNGDPRFREERIHPTQKPIMLYKKILSMYAKQGDRIFDPCFGSASSAIACYELGFDYVGCELDKEYFDNAVIRLKESTAQQTLFDFSEL